MASISKDSAGRRRIHFTLRGERKHVRIGTASKSSAETIRMHIQRCVQAIELGTALEASTIEWLNSIGETLYSKLAGVGLVVPRQTAKPGAADPGTMIEAFVDRYIGMRTDVKPNTLRTWRQTRALLVEHFGTGRQLPTVTAFEGRGFHSWLTAATVEGGARRFSPASVSKYTSFARQFFAAAIDAQIIGANPFAKIKLGKRKNDARQQFVGRETIKRVMDGCTDPEFKLILALSRYGGLRIPSELDGLLWQHIDRDRGRILIHSPKTEHHQGGATREIPLFPELIPYIDAWWEACPARCEHVIVSNRGAESAWRTRLSKLLHRLGIDRWPRLFHNLRASRQTELQERFPSHVVCQWLGNSEAIAEAHYLMTTDDHFAAAITSDTKGVARPVARKSRKLEEMARNGKTESVKIPGKSEDSAFSTGTDGNRTNGVFCGKSQDSSEGGAQGGAREDSDLAALIEVWPNLTDETRRQILELAGAKA